MPPQRRKQTIGLCMVVRDEAPRVQRWADTVRPLIDTWTIVDTGSVDGTPELVQEAFGDMPGTLHHSEWVDFEHNLNEAYELVRPTCDYVFTTDPDTTVEVYKPLPYLTADAYLVRQRYVKPPHHEYFMPSLLSTRCNWVIRGKTHGYWWADDAKFPLPDKELMDEYLTVLNHHDAEAGVEKWERDLKWLEEMVEKEPDETRWVFYLAQTLAQLDRPADAARWYVRRTEMGGWPEEAFYAMYCAGKCLLKAGDTSNAVMALLHAYELRPTRAEPLNTLAGLFKLIGHDHLAEMFDEKRLSLPFPAGDAMNVEPEAYESRVEVAA